MIETSLRDLVWRRGQDRCEYCRLPQRAMGATFHVEHIFARQHLPPDADSPENLALACHHCNLHKGTHLTSIDPVSGLVVPLFHPRRDDWDQHFALDGACIVGLTHPAGPRFDCLPHRFRDLPFRISTDCRSHPRCRGLKSKCSTWDKCLSHLRKSH